MKNPTTVTGLAVTALASLAVVALLHAQDQQDEEHSGHTGHLSLADAAPGVVEAPSLPIQRDEYIEVLVDSDEREVTFVIGPMELTSGMDHLRLPIQMAEFPVDGWIHGFAIDMLDSEGNAIPLDLLHHVNFIDPDKRELFSPIPRRVMAAGRETDAERLPRVVGYPIAAGDRMLIASMFANALERDYPDANLHVRFSYSTEADGFLQPRNVYPFYLDVMGPIGTKDFMVPPGKTTKSWEGSPAVDGRIIAIGGHVHDYATRLALVDVTDDRVIWEVEPEKDATGHVTGVPSRRFLWSLGKKIHPDHVYRIVVEYDNPLDTPAPGGGMGAIGGAVWIGKDAAWPAFDRSDEMYVKDLNNTLTAPDRLHGHGHGGMNVNADMSGMPRDEPTADGHGAHGH